MSRRLNQVGVVLCGLSGLLSAGCGQHSDRVLKASTEIRKATVSVVPAEKRLVERTVGMVGSLRGWEQVTIGSKRPGRVAKVLHDMGDRVKPGEPLVQLDDVDAKLAVQQAETKYLAELVKLGISRQQADEFVDRFKLNEKLIEAEEVQQKIEKVPAVLQMKSSLVRAERNLNRQRAVTERGAGSLQDLQNAENDYEGAKAAYDNAVFTAKTVIAQAMANRVALDQARQALADMTIRAPEPSVFPEGIAAESSLEYAMTKRAVSEGQMVREGEAVAELVVENPLRLWGTVPERYITDVVVGQLVRLEVSAHPGEEFAGRVARINPSVNEVSRTFQVEVLVPNPDSKLRPGGFAKARIVTRSAGEAIVVPAEAVVREAGVTKLFVIENDMARAVDVETGVEGRGWVEVIGKVEPGAQVVVTGQALLADETPVLIRKPPEEEGKAGEANPSAAAGEAAASQVDQHESGASVIGPPGRAETNGRKQD
jgi:RND family efflux transporter MFP subunit